MHRYIVNILKTISETKLLMYVYVWNRIWRK